MSTPKLQFEFEESYKVEWSPSKAFIELLESLKKFFPVKFKVSFFTKLNVYWLSRLISFGTLKIVDELVC